MQRVWFWICNERLFATLQKTMKPRCRYPSCRGPISRSRPMWTSISRGEEYRTGRCGRFTATLKHGSALRCARSIHGERQRCVCVWAAQSSVSNSSSLSLFRAALSSFSSQCTVSCCNAYSHHSAYHWIMLGRLWVSYNHHEAYFSCCVTLSGHPAYHCFVLRVVILESMYCIMLQCLQSPFTQFSCWFAYCAFVI
jgi:hypothetical protein